MWLDEAAFTVSDNISKKGTYPKSFGSFWDCIYLSTHLVAHHHQTVSVLVALQDCTRYTKLVLTLLLYYVYDMCTCHHYITVILLHAVCTL